MRQGQAVSFALEGDQDQKPFAMEALFDGKPLSDTEKIYLQQTGLQQRSVPLMLRSTGRIIHW